MSSGAQVSVEDLWIPLPDGTRLAARRWATAGEERPRPTIFEHLPYRLSDFRAGRDHSWYAPLAEAGYVGLRVDIRGTGNSDGHFEDEYSDQELDDAEAIIAWIRKQPWSDGSVGMIGISYSGFNALQLGTRNPEGLKAVIAAGFADDRFDQDVHRIGGGVHDQGLSWSQLCLGILSFPPDPMIVGEDRWLDQWTERLDGLEPPILRWLAHQRKDEFWRRESARDGYDDMRCAVYAVSGWNDRYRDGVLSLLSEYSGPRKGLIGPWEHAWPHEAGIGPRLDFITEAIRWFDHWLLGIDDGIMDESTLHAWVESSAPPSSAFREQDGTWVALDGWPAAAIEQRHLWSTSNALVDVASPLATEVVISDVAIIGLDGGVSAPFKSAATDLPRDQRAEDGRSTTFDTEPLPGPLALLGQAEFALALVSDVPLATVSVRLCDVFPDGTSRLITQGLLNLAMRDSSSHPTPLPVDRAFDAVVRFQGIGYEIAAGHRLRLAVSVNYWPWIWPSPVAPRLSIPQGSAPVLRLPVLDRAGVREVASHFRRDVDGASVDGTWLATADPEQNRTTVEHDLGSGTVERRSVSQIVSRPFRSVGADLTFRAEMHDRMVDGDPLSVTSTAIVDETLGRGDWQTSVDTITRISCDVDSFHVDVRVTAKHGGAIVRDLRWTRAIPRDLL